jgi:hypothetical protein
MQEKAANDRRQFAASKAMTGLKAVVRISAQ